MGLELISPLAFVAGLLALAGGLFALQRLRVRHREVPVETLLFWEAALEPARARVLTERFRHPWAYALLLLIAACMWLALAQPERRAPGERNLVWLDASASTSQPERFEATVGELRRALASWPRDAREVWWCGAGLEALLLPGEDLELFDARVRDRQSEDCAPSIDRALQAHLAMGQRQGIERWNLYLAGDAPIDDLQLDLLTSGAAGEATQLRRLVPDSDRPTGAGIVALGWRPHVDEPGLLDLWLRVGGERARAARPQLIRGDGTPAPAPVPSAPDGMLAEGDGGSDASNDALWWFKDVRADGSDVRIELRAGDGRLWSDGLIADDGLSWRLPDLRELWIALEPGLPASVRAAVEADPGLIPLDQAGGGMDSAAAAVRFAGSSFGASLPSLELTSMADGGPEAFTLGVPQVDDPVLVAEALVHQLALDQIDARGLATQMGRSLEVQLTGGADRVIGVWGELFGADFDWVEQRSFPIFCGAALRWVAGADLSSSNSLADSAWGEAPVQAVRMTSQGRNWQSLGPGTTAPATGRWVADLADGSLEHYEPLLSVAVTQPEAMPASVGLERAALPSSGVDFATWLIAASLLLLLIEWNLTRRGRMP